jgi:hypothetical protein
LKWLDLIQNELLIGVPKMKVVQSYRVCHLHFSAEQRIAVSNKNRSNLIRSAVPDLLLPPRPDQMEQLNAGIKNYFYKLLNSL